MPTLGYNSAPAHTRPHCPHSHSIARLSRCLAFHLQLNFGRIKPSNQQTVPWDIAASSPRHYDLFHNREHFRDVNDTTLSAPNGTDRLEFSQLHWLVGDTVAGGIINPFFSAGAPYKMLILKPKGAQLFGADAFILPPNTPHTLKIHVSYVTDPALSSHARSESVGPFGFIVVLYDVHTLTEQQYGPAIRFASVCVDMREWGVPCDLVRTTSPMKIDGEEVRVRVCEREKGV